MDGKQPNEQSFNKNNYLNFITESCLYLESTKNLLEKYDF